MDIQLKDLAKTLSSLNILLKNDKYFSSDSVEDATNGISLLSLKNQVLLAYLHSLTMIIVGRIELSQSNGSTMNTIRESLTISTKSSIRQRITLEKGIKGLESKLSYQIDKVIRAASEATRLQQSSDAYSNPTSNKGKSEPLTGTEDEYQELSLKPNARAFIKDSNRSSGLSGAGSTDIKDDNAKYKAPKVSPVTPFVKDRTSKIRQRKLSAMEEYLQSTSSAPVSEPSIGSTIIDHGRGGESSQRERASQSKIRNYEEENYVRLPSIPKKTKGREKRSQNNQFFGEDWGFSAGNDFISGTKRQKSSSVWERTKKRQRNV